MRNLWAKQNGGVAGCENSQPAKIRKSIHAIFFLKKKNIFKDFFFRDNFFLINI